MFDELEKSPSVPLSPVTPPFPVGIKAVLFDVDGTLYDQRKVRVAMVVQLAAWMLAHWREAVQVVRVIRSFRLAQERLRWLDTPTNDVTYSLSDAQLAVAAAGSSVAPGAARGGGRRHASARLLGVAHPARRELCRTLAVRRSLRRAGHDRLLSTTGAAAGSAMALVQSCMWMIRPHTDGRPAGKAALSSERGPVAQSVTMHSPTAFPSHQEPAPSLRPRLNPRGPHFDGV